MLYLSSLGKDEVAAWVFIPGKDEVPSNFIDSVHFSSSFSLFSKNNRGFRLTFVLWCAIVIVHYQTTTP